MSPLRLVGLSAVTLALALSAAGCKKSAAPAAKLQVASYEPTVELYVDLNAAFPPAHKAAGGGDVTVETTHGPSGNQSKKIVEGNAVDVAALSVDFDVDKIAEAGLLSKDWRTKFPNNASPYSSAVVFLVRKGNPKNVKDWEDLARDDVTGAAPDPKQGGGARWIYLATWAHALRRGGDEAAARVFTKAVYDKALLAPAQRQVTTLFLQGQADVLFGWENEILQIVADPKVNADYQLVVPSDSITIEVPVAVVDKVVDGRGTRALAEAYVNYLYSEAGQEIIAKRFNRPSNPAVLKRHESKFDPKLKLYKFNEHFKDWPSVMKQHFSTGGELDKMTGK